MWECNGAIVPFTPIAKPLKDVTPFWLSLYNVLLKHKTERDRCYLIELKVSPENF